MKKLLNVLTAVLCICALLLTACSGDSGGSSGSSDSGGGSDSSNTSSSDSGGSSNADSNEAPVPLTMFRMATDQDPSTDPILLELQARTNTKLTIITATWDQFVDELNLMMASGEKVDLILTGESGTPWRQWAAEGLLLEMDPYLASGNYPFIQSVCESDSFASYKVNGKSYVLPGVHHGNDWSSYVRQDWLDNLGLPMPTTLDEYYDMLVAFTYEDPDQNGVDDTYGIGAAGLGGGFTPVFAAYGAKKGPNTENLGIDVASDGSVYSNLFTENGKAALKYINMLVRDGLVNPDFATSSPDFKDQWIYTGKTGAIYQAANDVSPDLLANIPGGTASFTAMEPVTTAGYDVAVMSGPTSWLVFGATSQCENPEKALEFMDFVNSKEGRDLLIGGVKGRHYTEISEDGVFDRIVENWEEDYPGGDTRTPFWIAFFSTVYGYIPAKDYPTFEEAMAHKVIYAGTDELATGFSFQQGVGDGAKWQSSVPNPLHLYQLEEDGQLLQANLAEVLNVNYLRMAMATDADDIDEMWDVFMAEANQVGLQDWLDMYQAGYDGMK